MVNIDKMEKKMRPKVSIIVPVYNVERYLDRCIISLQEQSLHDIEIILVDDGSPDACPRICDNYKGKDSRIKVIHKNNEGLGYARNSGMEIANSEFIAFLDSDDFVEKDMYEKLYFATKQNNAEVCLCGFNRMTTIGKKYKCHLPFYNQLFKYEEIYIKIFLNLLGSKPDYQNDIVINASSCFGIYSTNLINKNNIRFFSERKYISEDLIFNLEVFKKVKRACVLNECLYTYCENRHSLTQTYKVDRYEQLVILDEKLQSLVENDEFYKEAKYRIQRSFLGRVRQCIYAEVNYFPFKKACINIRRICEQDYLVKTLQEFEINRLPKKLFIFSYFMKKKWSAALYVLVKIKKIPTIPFRKKEGNYV